jgi:hypothetical protein
VQPVKPKAFFGLLHCSTCGGAITAEIQKGHTYYRFGFRSPSKDNVSSRCSKDKLVRAPFLNHCALNNDERATHSRFPFTNVMWRVRGRLTLMLADGFRRGVRRENLVASLLAGEKQTARRH